MGKRKKRQTVIDSILADNSAEEVVSGLESFIYRKQRDVIKERPGGSGAGKSVSAVTGATSLSGVFEDDVIPESAREFKDDNLIDRELRKKNRSRDNTRALEKKARLNKKRVSPADTASPKGEADAVEVAREGVYVKLHNSNGKLKIKVSAGKRRGVSKEKLANIALDAILKELNKEG